MGNPTVVTSDCWLLTIPNITMTSTAALAPRIGRPAKHFTRQNVVKEFHCGHSRIIVSFVHHSFFRSTWIGKLHTKYYSSCHWSPQKRDRNGWEQAEKESIDVLCLLRWCGTRHQRKFTQQRTGRQSTPMEESKIWDGRRIWKVVSLWNLCVLRNFKIRVTMSTYINHEKIA